MRYLHIALLTLLIMWGCKSDKTEGVQAVTGPGSLVLSGFSSGDKVSYRVIHFYQIPPDSRIAGVVVNDTVPAPVAVVGQAAIDSVAAGAWMIVRTQFVKHKNESQQSAADRIKADYDNRKIALLNGYVNEYEFYGTFLGD